MADLIETCIHGRLQDVVEVLMGDDLTGVDNSKDFSARDGFEKTALDMMAMLGKTEVLKLLLQSGSNVNEHSTQGYTALHHAACWGQVDCLKELYFAGGDLSMKNMNQETAKDCAIRYGHSSAVDFLNRAEAQVDLQNLARYYKDVIADPEKNLGKFNKEDRVTGNRNCDEKLDWVENTKTFATLPQILQMKTDLNEFMRPIMAKLEDIAAVVENTKGNKSVSKPNSTR